MSIKKTLLAAALAAFAFAALPALASAEIEMDYEEPHFTVTGGETNLTTPSSKVECANVTGTGEFDSEDKQTGTISLVFHGCKSSGTSCGTKTAGSGTIETTPNLPFHLVTATDAEKNKVDGILITPTGGGETGHFATFKCAFGLVHIEVEGNGIIGEITDPDTNVESNTFTMNFASDGAGGQQYTTTCETGDTEFDLEATVNGGAAETAVQEGEGQIHFTNEKLGILTKK